MLVDSFHDTGVFFASFLCGQIVGFIFDIFRGYRKNKKVSKNMLSVQDSVFCAIAFYLFYKTVCLTNFGEIRWYTVAGAIMGLLLYFVAESCHILKVINIVWKGIFSVTGFFSKGFHRIFMFFKNALLKTKKEFFKAFSQRKPCFRQISIKKATKTRQNDVWFCKIFFEKNLYILKKIVYNIQVWIMDYCILWVIPIVKAIVLHTIHLFIKG